MSSPVHLITKTRFILSGDYIGKDYAYILASYVYLTAIFRPHRIFLFLEQLVCHLALLCIR